MLQVENLVVGYGTKIVLDNLNAKFHRGAVTGVLGLNGAGKTTLFNALYGAIPKGGGTVTLDNRKVTTKDIAYMETHNYFYPYLRGREYLELLSINNPSFNIQKWNEIFDLPLEMLIDSYSTGMKKKLAFLGTMSFDRPIIILDEPFSGVDVESNEKIFYILERLKKQNKVIILSSHILSSFKEVCDKVSYMNEKKIEKVFDRSNFDELQIFLKESVNNNLQNTLDDLISE